MKTRTKMSLAGSCAYCLAAGYPFNVTVAPEWKVKVVDENGKPLPGAYVSEIRIAWDVDFQHNEALCSNMNGEAQFVRHTVRASVLTRFQLGFRDSAYMAAWSTWWRSGRPAWVWRHADPDPSA